LWAVEALAGVAPNLRFSPAWLGFMVFGAQDGGIVGKEEKEGGQPLPSQDLSVALVPGPLCH